MKSISIIIPTYNRLDRLIKVLDGLEKQSFPQESFEVIVVSDGSSDGTVEYLSSLKTALNLQVAHQENQGVASARNRGIQEASGELVLFIDDDVVPTSWLITEHVRCHQQQGPDSIVIGPMLTPDDIVLSPWVHWEQEALAKQYRAMQAGVWEPTARQFYTGNTSLARHHLLESGGFDPSFRRAEDVELAYRLAERGLKFVFNPNAVGYHYAERSFASWAKTPYTYGRNDVIFSVQKGQTWLLPRIFEEFYTRHFLIQMLTKMTLDRKKLGLFFTNIFRFLATLGGKLHFYPLSNFACSAIFNMLYYQGIADELGGKRKFQEGLQISAIQLQAKRTAGPRGAEQ
jgi:glycosyltransferase involved in cell wall biosynthesis